MSSNFACLSTGSSVGGLDWHLRDASFFQQLANVTARLLVIAPLRDAAAALSLCNYGS